MSFLLYENYFEGNNIFLSQSQNYPQNILIKKLEFCYTINNFP